MKQYHNINSEISFTYIFSKKRQTLIAALGVTFGIAVFIFMNSMMRGFDRSSTETLFKAVPHLRIYNEPGVSAPIAEIHQNQLPILINPKITNTKANIQNPEEVMIMLKRQEDVVAVAPEVSASVFYNNGEAQVNGIASGVKMEVENSMFDVQSNLVDGNVSDLLNTQNGIILGIGIADKLNARLNDNITVTSSKKISKVMKVVGLLKTGNAQVDKTKSYINISVAQQLLKEGPSYITDIYVNITDYKKAKEHVSEFSALTNYKVENWEASNVDAVAANKMRKTIALAISCSIMLVAGFGIYNILSMTVMQKINEIAILKAMGFTGTDVIRIFVQQSLFIGFIGVIIGLVLASLLVNRMGHFYIGGSIGFFPIRFEPGFFVLGAAFGMVVTFVAGYFPAKKAANVDPVAIFRK